MRNIRLFTLSLFAAICANIMAETIFSFTLTSATTDLGTYEAVGGTAECTRAMATGGSNEVTIGSQTFFKFNTSSAWTFTLNGNTLAVGDVLTFTCACSSAKNGKGLVVNEKTLTNDFPANATNTLTYTVVSGDAFVGKNTINVKRADSDIKFGTIEITRGEGGGESGGGEGGGDTPGGDTPGGGDTPETNLNVIFNWEKTGSNGFSEDMTDLNNADQGNMTVGTSVYGRKFGEDNVSHNNKGYKLGNNSVCIEIQGTSDFVAGDIVTIKGVCGGSGKRAFAIAPETTNDAVTDTAMTNTQENSSTTLEYKVIVKEQQAGTKMRVFRMAGKTMYLSAIKVERIVPAGPSSDATLSALTYGTEAKTVDGFTPSQETYEVELPATYVGSAPSIQGTPNHANATISDVTQATSVPGTATITVTAEDGTTTKTYTVNFTRASSAPKVTSVSWDNMSGTPTIDNVQHTITGQVTNGSSLTAITPTFTGSNIDRYTPTEPQDFSAPVNYIFFSEDNVTTQYTVTITEAPALSSDATLQSLTYGGTSVPNFSPSTYEYNIPLNYGQKTPPQLAAKANDEHATLIINQPQSIPGSGSVEVTAEDGTTKLTYTVNYTVTVPETGLTLHEPEVYEAKDIAGGYGGKLSDDDEGYQYEVYYASFDNDGNLTVTVAPAQKNNGITTSLEETKFTANDGWFEGAAQDGKSNFTFTDLNEFKAGAGAMHKMRSNDTYTLHVKGYDLFTFYGKDNNADKSKGKHFVVTIDTDEEQPMNLSSSATLRSFPMTTGEHVITVKAIGESKCEFYGFSLRIAREPRIKWLKGNDTTQVILQGTAPKPVQYFAKHNTIPGAQTRLTWIGEEARGIGLDTTGHSSLGDTLRLSGIANCPVGEYNYRIVTYYNGTETSAVTGKFSVRSEIRATTGTHIDAYQNEDIEPIQFTYYALSEQAVTIAWKDGNEPAGITTNAANGKYTISGVPTVTGEFVYTVSVADGNSITDTINVVTFDPGNNPVLYLYKNDRAYDKDGVYTYLRGKGKNLIARKTKEDGPRAADQYARYKWVMISEDADADNAEVLAVVRGGSKLPVLNMKGFTYTWDRLNWGEPDNGAIDSAATKKNGCFLHVQHPDHPVYAKLTGVKNGDSLQILSGYERNGIMPINVNVQGSLCLGTAHTRSLEDYYGLGELQTALHEVPADMRSGHKYICLPLAKGVTLSDKGQKLMEGIVDYLLDPTPSSIEAPDLQINKFTVGEYTADIDQGENTITLNFPADEYDNLETAQPKITLADPNTHVTPSVTPSIDLRYSVYLPKVFTVSDYINRRSYSLTIVLYDPQGIGNTYEAGEWVNIYDIFGRIVAVTNEDIHSMELPRGMYIVVTENGNTLKIMR